MNLGRVIYPYGMKRNIDGDWVIFNKQEAPVGCFSLYNLDSFKLPVRLKLKGLGEETLSKLANSPEAIIRDSRGRICRVYFYLLDKDRLSPEYMEKLRMLESIQINQLA